MGVPHRSPCRLLPLGSANYRWMTAILMFFVLGLQLVNAQSTSHLQLEHRHPAAAVHDSAAGTGHQHEHDVAPDDEGREHTHKHNPGDHTHDLPLRLVGAAIEFAFMPDWLPAIPVSVRSNTLYPLERPPRRRRAA